ncbi:hypothetical protein FQN60_007816, partial [Etheostoma spectabile]
MHSQNSFSELRAEVKAFMEKDGMADSVLSDPKWLMDFALLVDITQELNVLKKKLQARGRLSVMPMIISQTNLCHFPACKAFTDVGTPFSGEKYADAIMKLQEEFDCRCANFKTHRDTFQIFADPYSFNVQDAPPVLQTELNDLQCNSELKAKFRESGNADNFGQFLRELPPTFPELSRMFKQIMCLFGSTYLCEKLFSTMKFNKTKYRSKLTDGDLQAVLRVSTVSSFKPNVSQLCERKRCQPYCELTLIGQEVQHGLQQEGQVAHRQAGVAHATGGVHQL